MIKSLDLHINSGEFVVIVGPSGCGKSTLLRMIAGLEEISSGGMYIDGNYVNDDTPAERGIGMVFQSYALYPHMSVYKNMAFALELAGHSAAEIDSRVRESARICSSSRYWNAARRIFRAGSGNGWRLVGPSCASLSCFIRRTAVQPRCVTAGANAYGSGVAA